MLLPPIDLTDASILLAIGAIILIVTAQISPTSCLPTDPTIDKKKLDNAAIVTGAMLLITIILKVIGIISTG